MPLLFNLRHVIQIPSFRIVNLLCCGGHLGSTTFTDAKTKYRSPSGRRQNEPLGVTDQTIWERPCTVFKKVLKMSAGDVPCITYRALWGHSQEVTLGRLQDVISQCPKDVSGGRPQDVSRGFPLALHRGPYGDVHRTYFGDVLRTPSGNNFAEWEVNLFSRRQK